MKHAREDYNRIQDIYDVSVTTNGTTRLIPADEPVFLIRGQDAVGGDAVRAWADLAESKGAAFDILQRARDHAAKMDAWPKKKIPDLSCRPQKYVRYSGLRPRDLLEKLTGFPTWRALLFYGSLGLLFGYFVGFFFS